MRKFLLICILSLTVLFANPPFIHCNNIYWTKEPEKSIATSSNITNQISLESESAILIEQNSGKVLYEKNSHSILPPASVTKVMSILLIMEALDSNKIHLEDKVPCSQNAANMGGSQIWLDTREELTVNEMLKAICVASANDATVAMAEFLSGSEEAFVQKMNEKAKELGMNDTTFRNCHGLDTEGHVTSSYDIALMSRELLKNHPNITNYTTIYMDTLRDGKSELVNTNKLIRNYKGATGLKTGSTSLALYNLSASATRDNLSLIAVIMRAPTTALRFSEAQKLLDYGFSNYSYISLAKKNDFITKINVTKGVDNSVDLIFEDNSGALLSKGQQNNIEQSLSIPENIEAPILKGQKIGEIKYIFGNETIGSTNIVASSDVKKLDLSNMTEKLFFSWFSLLRQNNP
ncbi:MAG: D-alanyl-D-alanine carboxypeptidase [Clostridia bacterium]|nr:D-alanyl-D-alanine carboxypeptidase [Clostridia bacterium]